MLGYRLKSMRELKDLTQAEIANEIGLSRERYNQYENNRRAPDYDTLLILADFFHVSTDYLLGRTDDPTPILGRSEQVQENKTLVSQPISTKHLTSNEESLLRIFRKLQTDTYQEKAINQFAGYVDCLVEIESNDDENVGKLAPSTPSKKNVG